MPTKRLFCNRCNKDEEHVAYSMPKGEPYRCRYCHKKHDTEKNDM